MSEGLNRVILLGNLGADPELRSTQNGGGVLSMRVATTETYVDRDKNRKERVEWHSVVMFGNRAEGLARVLHKGARILVEGGLRTSSYEDRDGNKRYKTEVQAHNVVLLGGRGDSSDAEGEGAEQPASGRRGSAGHDDFEVPFGRDKGKRISEVGDLSWLRGAFQKELDDPKKAQYHATTRARIAAIDAELARRNGEGARAAARAGGDSSHGRGPARNEWDEGSAKTRSWADDELPF